MDAITAETKILIRVFLLRSGKTQQWLARRVGIHESTLTRILNGERIAPVKVAQKIEAITGVKVVDAADVAMAGGR